MQTLLIKTYRSFYPNDGEPGRETTAHTTELTPVEARQGVISGRVATVLIGSLILAAFSGALLAAVHMFPI